MSAARFPLLLALGACACAPVVEVRTEPVNQPVPITGVGLQAFVELAIDLPPASQGDVQVLDASADLVVQNSSGASNMTVEIRVSLVGTATPEIPYPFTQLNKPAYYADAVPVLGPTTYYAGTTTPEHIPGTGLVPALGQPRVWLIVSNTLTSLGWGDLFPLRIDLHDIVLHAVVTKSLAGINGGLEATGL